jgi:hypothetical protein
VGAADDLNNGVIGLKTLEHKILASGAARHVVDAGDDLAAGRALAEADVVVVGEDALRG